MTDTTRNPSNTPDEPQRRISNLLLTDAEREEAASIVHRALAEGSLTVEEAEERLGASYAARRRGELREVLVDLPQNQRSQHEDSRRGGLVRLTPRLAAVAALCAVAVALSAGASASGHAPWPLLLFGFFAVRAFWWRRGWHGGWAGRTRLGAPPHVGLETRRSEES